MSLIALREHLRSGRSAARTLLLMIALTGVVIVGLLAMHSLNLHSSADSGHQSSTAADASSTSNSHATAAEDSCADCGTGHSDMLAMACVLALLAVVLILARPRITRLWLALRPRPGPGLPAPFRAEVLHPPSLIVLCISRT